MIKNLDISLTLLLTVALTVTMLWPFEALYRAPAGRDKLVHFMAFAVLVFPITCTGRLGLLPVFIGASAFGGIIELIQPSFNRSADMNDWIADTLGVLFGVGFGLMHRSVKQY